MKCAENSSSIIQQGPTLFRSLVAHEQEIDAEHIIRKLIETMKHASVGIRA